MKSVDNQLKKNFPYQELTYQIIGAGQEVHKELGNGFLESVYQEALEIEFRAQNIPYVREVALVIEYKGNKLDRRFYADFICFGKIIIETKALNNLTSDHQGQVLNYLKATRLKLGLLMNFGEPSLKVKRIIK